MESLRKNLFEGFSDLFDFRNLECLLVLVNLLKYCCVNSVSATVFYHRYKVTLRVLSKTNGSIEFLKS